MPYLMDPETASALKRLVNEYLMILTTHYRSGSATKAPWYALTQPVRDLHRVAVRLLPEETAPPYPYLEAVKALVSNHWPLWRTHEGEEPSASLIEVIDWVERNSPVWFSYQRGEWVEE